MERLNNSQKHFDLYGWHALKGQKLLAQDCYGPQASAPSGRVGKNLRNFYF